MKARLISQPLSGQTFGHVLIEELESERWTALDISVAWVRLYGVLAIEKALTKFLKTGGTVLATVGIDKENTSIEGLQALLRLGKIGNIDLYIHHNEDASLVYHPKLYVFSNDTDTKAIVGSNNLTQAGLYRNTEAALELEGLSNAEVFDEMRDVILRWRMGDGKLSRKLDAALLRKLIKRGYIKQEKALKREPVPGKAGKPQAARAPLFGYVPVAAPPTRKLKTAPLAATTKPSTKKLKTGSGQQLVIRVRLARGTQAQVPIRLKEAPFLEGIDELTSLSNGAKRGIHEAKTSGATRPNTLKIELPDASSISDPILLLHRADDVVTYVIFDRHKGIGRQHWKFLVAGLKSEDTETTVPSNPERATMWRFM